MDRDDNDLHAPDWVKRRLDRLRRQLEAGETPPGLERLWRDLDAATPAGGVDENEEAMLSLVLNDALKGIDISDRYPDFYRRMLADANLRYAFLESLAILMRDAAGELEPLPQAPGHDLAFLEEQALEPAVTVAAEGQGWRITWHHTLETLRVLFSAAPPAAAPAYPSGRGPLEDDVLTLLRSNVAVAELELDVVLEVIRPAATPGELHPFLMVTPESATALPALCGTLDWGTYSETVAVTAVGVARFPAIPLPAILDEREETLSGTLTLTVETTE